jgi:diguanylate cyclase (GGDEF)-like protein
VGGAGWSVNPMSMQMWAAHKGLRNYLLVLGRSTSQAAGRYLLPFALVVPVIVYAYFFRAIVTSHAEQHEREIVLRNLSFISARLSELMKADTATCRDYAHWDDTCRQVDHPNSQWLETNIETGLVSYGFDVAVLTNSSGQPVWSSHFTEGTNADMLRQGTYAECMRRGVLRGLFLLDGKIVMGSAVSVRRSDHTGQPRGVLFVGRHLDGLVMKQIAPGPEHQLILCPYTRGAASPRFLSVSPEVPSAIVRVADGRLALDEKMIEVSRNGHRYYAALPLYDRRGTPVAALIDISSRLGLVRTLRAIKQMSVILMVLCILVGFAGVSYLRTRELAARARRDELTGLHNHGYLQQYLRTQVHFARRYGRPLSLMMLDIDHFKVLNDTHGHSVGDRVLQQAAQLMAKAMRDTDLVARYGGEEFVIVMPETEPEQALAAAERIREATEAAHIRYRGPGSGHTETDELSITLSAGVASFPEDGQSAPELLASADAALMVAKRTRNAVIAYDEIVRATAGPILQGSRLEGFLRDSSMASIRPLIAAIDLRDANTASHSEKTAEYAVAIGQKLGFSTQKLALACKAALLHDVGMIAIPDHLLAKPSSLTPEEMETMQRHVELGSRTLLQSPQLAPVAEIVRAHHERFDGAGYPDGLSGEGIPMIARVIAVADTLDAMTSDRSYRAAMRLDEAAEVLIEQSGKQFDPAVVEAAVAVIDDMLDYQAKAA